MDNSKLEGKNHKSFQSVDANSFQFLKRPVNTVRIGFSIDHDDDNGGVEMASISAKPDLRFLKVVPLNSVGQGDLTIRSKNNI